MDNEKNEKNETLETQETQETKETKETEDPISKFTETITNLMSELERVSNELKSSREENAEMLKQINVGETTTNMFDGFGRNKEV